MRAHDSLTDSLIGEPAEDSPFAGSAPFNPLEA